MISKSRLKFWIDHELNVLFFGKHGIGKTSIILEAFQEAGLKYKYFSVPTMDPWVDFIGVPKSHTSSRTGKTYLKLVRPKDFAEDDVDVILCDELNRGNLKVRNALMELIQFKSINGHKFNNLKMVWAAVNPEDDPDEKYDVEPLDPAQKDRFQIHVHLPYLPDSVYFTKRYTKDKSDAALKWWSELPKEQKNLVSPRRLDYALEHHKRGGDLSDVLPSSTNVGKLVFLLGSSDYLKELETVFKDKDRAKAKRMMTNENTVALCIPELLKFNNSEEMLLFYLPLLNKDRLVSLAVTNQKIGDLVTSIKHCKVFKETLKELLTANFPHLPIYHPINQRKRKPKQGSIDQATVTFLVKIMANALKDYGYSDLLGLKQAKLRTPTPNEAKDYKTNLAALASSNGTSIEINLANALMSTGEDKKQVKALFDALDKVRLKVGTIFSITSVNAKTDSLAIHYLIKVMGWYDYENDVIERIINTMGNTSKWGVKLEQLLTSGEWPLYMAVYLNVEHLHKEITNSQQDLLEVALEKTIKAVSKPGKGKVRTVRGSVLTNSKPSPRGGRRVSVESESDSYDDSESEYDESEEISDESDSESDVPESRHK